MADPLIVSCPANIWTKVATNTTDAYIWPVNIAGKLLYSYRITGEAAPSDTTDAVSLNSAQHVTGPDGIDVYIYSKDSAGSVRVDVRTSGFSVINKFGVNLDIDSATVPETIWSNGGAFPFLSVGISMDVVSTDAADTLAGTGAQKVEITHYDDANVQTVAVYDLNGVTPVQLPGTVKIVTRMRVTQVGTGTTNAGVVKVVDRATGIVIYQSISIGEGQTLSAVQIVPAGKKGVVKSLYAGYARAGAAFNNANLRFRVRSSNGSITTKYPCVISSSNSFESKDYNGGGISLSAGDIAFWECILVSADNTPITAGFDLELRDL